MEIKLCMKCKHKEVSTLDYPCNKCAFDKIADDTTLRPKWESKIKEECKVDSKFKVGNLVKVVDTGEQYPHYDEWINKLCPSFKDKWSRGVNLETDDIGKVVFVGKHLNGRAVLCLIEVDSNVYIIGEDGLELVEHKFKVGDMITGNDSNSYGLTDEYSVCEVINVINERLIEVKIIDHESRQYCIGRTYGVQSEYFDLVSDVEDLEDVEDINLVFIKYDDIKKYLFLVPKGVKLAKGEMVFTNTKYGEKVGTCASNSFVVTNEAYKEIMLGQGITNPNIMKYVTGTAVTQSEYRKEEF